MSYPGTIIPENNDMDKFIQANYLVVSGNWIYSFNDKEKAVKLKDRLDKKYGKYGYVTLYSKEDE